VKFKLDFFNHYGAFDTPLAISKNLCFVNDLKYICDINHLLLVVWALYFSGFVELKIILFHIGIRFVN
jgi:hypothetical protein